MQKFALIRKGTARMWATTYTPAIACNQLRLAEGLTAIRAGDRKDVADIARFDIGRTDARRFAVLPTA